MSHLIVSRIVLTLSMMCAVGAPARAEEQPATLDEAVKQVGALIEEFKGTRSGTKTVISKEGVMTVTQMQGGTLFEETQVPLKDLDLSTIIARTDIRSDASRVFMSTVDGKKSVQSKLTGPVEKWYYTCGKGPEGLANAKKLATALKRAAELAGAKAAAK